MNWAIVNAWFWLNLTRAINTFGQSMTALLTGVQLGWINATFVDDLKISGTAALAVFIFHFSSFPDPLKTTPAAPNAPTLPVNNMSTGVNQTASSVEWPPVVSS